LFLQFVSLENASNVNALEAEASRLEQSGVLSRSEREALDLPQIALFWQSEVGQRVLAHRGSIHRELPFTARFSGSDLATLLSAQADKSPLAKGADAAESPGEDSARISGLAALSTLPDEFIVVQGVVDLAVLLPAEIWFLDFKTDEISASEWRSKVATYGPQLKLYSQALGRIYRRSVTNCWLHFLKLGRTVECSR
jgi:ATP-dependent helicase/nuclease subunit A